jgi:cell division septum initiation protein DivIVA
VREYRKEYRTAEDLLRQIEILRRRLKKFEGQEKLSSKKVCMLGRQLDRLLVRYLKVVNGGRDNK